MIGVIPVDALMTFRGHGLDCGNDPYCEFNNSITPGKLRTINMYHTYTIRRESTREELKSSRRDEKCKARTAVGRGEEESATYVTSDLSYD